MTDDLAAWLPRQIDADERMLLSVDSTTLNMAGEGIRDYVERGLAEVEFKRRILAIHRRRADVTGEPGGAFDNCCHGCGYEGICDDPIVENINDCPERQALADVYADRPGYLPEWSPQ